jgi:hypothetical protein
MQELPKKYKAPAINPANYGDFFLRSRSKDSLRYLNAIENDAYNEVYALLKLIDGVTFKDDLLRA